MPQDLDRI